LPDGKHHYLYSTEDLPLTSLPATKELKTYLDATPGLNVQYVFIFLDSQKNRISHVVHTANRNNTVTVPDGTAFVRFGWRVYNSGACTIKQLQWGHRVLNPELVIGRSQHLVLTNHYPSYDDLYRNGFVHSRVAAYADRGLKVDIFRLRKDEALSHHEFQNVDVITGANDALNKLLACGHYKTVLVHFLDEAMWKVLQHHIDRVRVIVWVHGAEIHPWYRRDYNYVNESERSAAKVQSEHRMRFWRGLLRNIPENLQLVFVSKYFAEEVMEDLGFRLPESKYHIIHNPIDTDLFAFRPKPVEQRKKILSIRPYASRQYANDLSVQAIMELSTKPWFKELEFRMIGDGKLFEEVLGPLRQFDNVIIERRFLSQSEIARLHHDYGVFLCPSRWDSQGVSRDEAMSSGLVPVTNLIAAIPEFVDESCGVLAGPDDAVTMAEGIAYMYKKPDLFKTKSKAASDRVRLQSSKEVMVASEIKLIKSLC
jgi:glycosyltransferase involved in cell wall biosynthesis